ncbi:hypothetical protein ACP275_12G017000 [Erythranthe tilingii]
MKWLDDLIMQAVKDGESKCSNLSIFSYVTTRRHVDKRTFDETLERLTYEGRLVKESLYYKISDIFEFTMGSVKSIVSDINSKATSELRGLSEQLDWYDKPSMEDADFSKITSKFEDFNVGSTSKHERVQEQFKAFKSSSSKLSSKVKFIAKNLDWNRTRFEVRNCLGRLNY